MMGENGAPGAARSNESVKTAQGKLAARDGGAGTAWTEKKIRVSLSDERL